MVTFQIVAGWRVPAGALRRGRCMYRPNEARQSDNYIYTKGSEFKNEAIVKRCQTRWVYYRDFMPGLIHNAIDFHPLLSPLLHSQHEFEMHAINDGWIICI